MTDISKATPRPWRVKRYEGGHYGIDAADGSSIIRPSVQPGGWGYGGIDPANAALIVQAMNAYDTMREALEAVRRWSLNQIGSATPTAGTHTPEPAIPQTVDSRNFPMAQITAALAAIEVGETPR